MLEVPPAVVAGLFAPRAAGPDAARAHRGHRGRVLPGLTGLVEAPEAWLPALRQVDPHVGVRDRLVAVLPPGVDLPAAPAGVRPLTPADVHALDAVDASIAWIGETWGGSAGLAGSGYAVVAVEGDRVLSVACSFYVGRGWEDIGVVTDPGARGRGLSTACAAALAADVRRRGKQPSWTTGPDNTASRAVAARLGFVLEREDVLYAVGTPVPTVD